MIDKELEEIGDMLNELTERISVTFDRGSSLGTRALSMKLEEKVSKLRENFSVLMLNHIKNGLKDSFKETIRGRLDEAVKEGDFIDVKMLVDAAINADKAETLGEIMKVLNEDFWPVCNVICEIVELAIGKGLATNEVVDIPEAWE